MSIFNDPLQQQAFNLLNPTSSANNLSLLQQADAIREQNALDTLAQQQRAQQELTTQKRNPREGFINFLDLLSDTGLRLQGEDPATYKATQKELLLELEDKKRKRQKALEQKEQLGTVIGNLNIPKSQKDFILSLNQASQADVVSKLMFPGEKKLTAAQKNLQAYFEIINNPNATQEQKRMARSLIGGIGQSPEQIEQSLKLSLVKQITPISERPLTQKEIEERLKTFRELNQDTMDDNLPFNDVYSFDEEFAKELVEKYKNLK